MRIRVMSAAVVLTVAIVGIALAQQTGGKQPMAQASERPKLRGAVVKLQVEIELLQLEHDVAREMLLDLMRTASKSDTLELALSMMGMPKMQGSATVPKTEGEMSSLQVKAMMGDQKAVWTLKKLDEIAERAEKTGQDREKAMAAAAKELAKMPKDGDPVRNQLEIKRKDFARQATELAEKRLELAEVEKRYNDAR